MPEPIIILTGAGISQESGLSTFRDKDGLWSKVKIEDVATPEAFARDPQRVDDFYNARRSSYQSGNVKPNAAHLALARLEAEYAGDVLIVTQNIDNLHEAAGSKNIIHMHGELFKVRCEACKSVHDWTGEVTRKTPCPSCSKTALRPHIVWFGEMPFEMDTIYDRLAECGLFISIGTSGNVYPAAGFVSAVGQNRTARTIELNMEPSQGASLFDEARYGPATQVVPAFVEELLAS
jgi:NAD-dependent deacetylase